MPVVDVQHLVKEYRLGTIQGLRQTLRNAASLLSGRGTPRVAPFRALDDVNFTVEAGEVVGIIGHNGAGKSTLLKMLARISTPTSGRCSVQGRIAPLIEVGAGFVGDFTGRENVYLNGAILGLKKREIDRKFDEIVDFAEMAEFIDTPVKRYSSGMQVKLAFAVATSIESEVLIVDEVLAVGDLAFQRKCFDRMEDLIKRQGRTVLVVSHNIRQVERMCNRVIVMDHGRVAFEGPSRDGCNFFMMQSDERIHAEKAKVKSASGGSSRLMSTGEIELIGLSVYDAQGKATTDLQVGTSAKFVMRFQTTARVARPIIGFGFHTTDLLYLATTQSIEQIEIDAWDPGVHEVAFDLKVLPFLPGVYSLRVGVALGDYFQMLFYSEDVVQVTLFDIDANRAVQSQPGEGFVRLDGSWNVEDSGNRTEATSASDAGAVLEAS